MDHVHAAGEAEPAGLARRELDRRGGVGGQRSIQGEVGKYHPRRALPALLPVEEDAQRNALADADEVGRIASPDRYADLLDLPDELCLAGPFRTEEIPGKKGDQSRSRADHDQIDDHGLSSEPGARRRR